jgi:hypothetical protein
VRAYAGLWDEALMTVFDSEITAALNDRVRGTAGGRLVTSEEADEFRGKGRGCGQGRYNHAKLLFPAVWPLAWLPSGQGHARADHGRCGAGGHAR